MNKKAMTFWRNIIASQEFMLVRESSAYLSTGQIIYNGKAYAITVSDSVAQPVATYAGPLVGNHLDLREMANSSMYLIHERRFITGKKLHVDILRKVEPRKIVRFSENNAKTHGYLTVFDSEINLVVSSIMDAQDSEGYDDCGVRFDTLFDGWPALVIDGWLADYSKLKSLNPVDCLDYTRRKVEENGGIYRRDEFGRFIR